MQTPLFNKIIGNALPPAYHLFDKLDALIGHHAGYRYTDIYGNDSLLGNSFTEVKGSPYTPFTIDRYPLPDVWRKFYRDEIGNFPALLQLLFALSVQWGERQTYKVHEFMNKEFLPEIKKFYGFDLYGLKKAMDKLPHLQRLHTILHLLGEEYWDASFANKIAENILTAFFPLLDKGSAKKEFIHETYTAKERRTVFLFQHSSIYYWMSDAFGSKDSADGFAEYFAIRYSFYRKADYLTTVPPAAITKSPLSVFDFAYSYTLGLISEEEMIRELQTRANAEESLNTAAAFLSGTLKAWQRNRMKAYGQADFAPLKEVVRKVSDHILDIELKRDERITDVSHLAMKMERIEGAKRWVDILKALGNESFGKSDHIYGASFTRKEVLSHLLCVCYPAPEDTAATLSELVKQTSISNERLMEAALYAPQWLEIVETCTGWKGLQNAACFFHAHVNDRCDDRMKAHIARLTPISPDDLCAGAFDLNWFREVCRETGARRFDKIFNAARIIASGSEYARFSGYLNVLNGKTNTALVRKQIEEKRNRDLLMSYGLIPLNKRGNSDLCERYQYLRQFLKETKAFGSQRQESEKKAVELAMINLACNAGYTDVCRMIWSVETMTLKLIQPCFTPKEKGDVRVYMKVDPQGKPGIHYFKAGKALINIPGKLRKDPYVRTLRETCKHLKSIYAQADRCLEEMMEEQTPFLASELNAFRKNPLLWPLLKRIVFITDQDETGFYTENGLLAPDGNLCTPNAATRLRIAHPADLNRLQLRNAYRDHLQKREIEQPFEQIFRAYYEKTEEEQSSNSSLRHAGRRISSSQIASTLETRRWTPAGAERWQKIYYREQVAVAIETQNQALTPTEPETFVLERITFAQRKQNAPRLIADVSDNIFSDIIRDIHSLFDE
ncbi:MAG: DUF4132 domain-containing protein [Tannerellaceae bacterium]|nr:DUF4132 domain-containing protein [Tannerellaceae bacterium]